MLCRLGGRIRFSLLFTVDGRRLAACEPALIFFFSGVMDCNLELSTNKPFFLTMHTNDRERIGTGGSYISNYHLVLH